jgi:hypothetical protein
VKNIKTRGLKRLTLKHLVTYKARAARSKRERLRRLTIGAGDKSSGRLMQSHQRPTNAPFQHLLHPRRTKEERVEGDKSIETFWDKACRELYRRTVLTEVQRQKMTKEELDNSLWEAARPWEEQSSPSRRMRVSPSGRNRRRTTMIGRHGLGKTVHGGMSLYFFMPPPVSPFVVFHFFTYRIYCARSVYLLNIELRRVTSRRVSTLVESTRTRRIRCLQ